VAVVNATDNSFITLVNATEPQLPMIKYDNKLGFDSRQSMLLRLRGLNPQN